MVQINMLQNEEIEWITYASKIKWYGNIITGKYYWWLMDNLKRCQNKLMKLEGGNCGKNTCNEWLCKLIYMLLWVIWQ